MVSSDFADRSRVVQEFVAEFSEQLSAVEGFILRLEKEPDSRELANEIFRPVHSLKGAAGLLGFVHVREFSHRFENLLGALRSGRVIPGRQLIDLLLRCSDALRQMVRQIADGGDGSAVNVADQYEGIAAALEAPSTGRPAESLSSDENLEIFLAAAAQHLGAIETVLSQPAESMQRPTVDVLFRAFHSLKASASYMGYGRLAALVAAAEEALESFRRSGRTPGRAAGDAFRAAHAKICLTIDRIKAAGTDDSAMDGEMSELRQLCRPDSAPEASAASAQAAAGARLAENTVRIAMPRLDALVNLMGELIVHQSRLGILEQGLEREYAASDSVRELKNVRLAMDRMMGELYQSVMGMRMMPVGALFNRFPRLVREVGRMRGRQAELLLSGEETEIDKNISDDMADPIMHLIRNAVDHGIEPPAVRAAAGKRPSGTVTLSACQANGSVIITVADDGRGVDLAAVREQAVGMELLTAEQAAALDDAAVMNFIFKPGFSTAKEVTDVSGRGVGLDIVKNTVERLRGKVRVQAVPGAGTTFTVELPLTMAIIEALMVGAGEETYAVPLFAISSIVDITSADIKTVRGAETIDFHGQSIGVVRLSRLMGIPPRSAARSRAYVVVLETGRIRDGEPEFLGFIVDDLCEKQKVVVKSVDGSLGKTPGIGGVTILGDGKVVLILDPPGLVAMAGSHAAAGP